MNCLFDYLSLLIYEIFMLIKIFMVSDRNLRSGIPQKDVSVCQAEQALKRGNKICSVHQGSMDQKVGDRVL